MNLNTDFIVPLTIVRAKGITDINVKHKIIKLLVNSIGEKSEYPYSGDMFYFWGVGLFLLYTTPNV